MTDRELLERAAKAAGIPLEFYIEAPGYSEDGTGRMAAWVPWNPLADDGDALRLAVNLRIDIAHTNIHSPQVHALADAKVQTWEDSGTDPYAATRRAIVRAAAAMGEQE